MHGKAVDGLAAPIDKIQRLKSAVVIQQDRVNTAILYISGTFSVVIEHRVVVSISIGIRNKIY